jgi:hypothetical protein
MKKPLMKRPQFPNQTPHKNWKGIYVFFLSLLGGVFLFMLVALVVIQMKGPLMPSLNKNYRLFFGILALISFACLILSKKGFNTELADAKNSLNPLGHKLNLYSNALVKYVVVCDVPVMLSIVLYLLTGNFMFLVYAAVFLGFLLPMTPTRKKVAEQLELTVQEQRELE